MYAHELIIRIHIFISSTVNKSLVTTYGADTIIFKDTNIFNLLQIKIDIELETKMSTVELPDRRQSHTPLTGLGAAPTT